MCYIVNDLLDVSKILNNQIVLRKEKIELNRLVLDIANDHKQLFTQRDIELQIKMPNKSIRLDADPVRIHQMIDNLLNNALKYTDSGGETKLLVNAENGIAIITVADSGIGIGSESLPNLFKPFLQVPTSFAKNNTGLGLGLYITKRIAELHGGTVQAASEGLGKGSSFTIRLPLLQSI